MSEILFGDAPKIGAYEAAIRFIKTSFSKYLSGKYGAVPIIKDTELYENRGGKLIWED